MRICLYVGKAPPAEKQEEWLANAKSTCDVFAANLFREFTSRGHEVVFASSLAARPKDCSEEESAKRIARYEKMEFPEADHAICLQQNGWRVRESIFFEKARAATKGLVCAICDHDNVIDGPQDILFTARRPVNPGRGRYSGWAADLNLFTPDKDPDWLTIFVDHKYHLLAKHDHTEALLKSATTYAARLDREGRRVGTPPRRVQVVFFSPDGLERIEPGDIRDIDLGTDRRAFYRRVPGPELAAWTRKADIFVVTHGESMGLPVLENAMAGALVVSREGFVKPELLRPLAHYEYQKVEQIDWDALVERIDPARSRRRASHFTWAAVAQRMLDTLFGRDAAAGIDANRQGRLLVSPPAPVPSDVASLAGWRTHHVRVEPAHGTERIVPTSGKPLHFVRKDVRKDPWPETFTFTFIVRPNGTDQVVVWLCGEFDNERAEIRFDLTALEPSAGRTTNGWVLLDAKAVPFGDEVVCQVIAQSDYAPILRSYILLARAGNVEFEAGTDEPGLEIRRVQLGKGVGLVAEVEGDVAPVTGRLQAVSG